MTIWLRFARVGDHAEVRANGNGLDDVAVADCDWERVGEAEGIAPGWRVTLRRVAGRTRPVEGDRLKFDSAADVIELLSRRLRGQGAWWKVAAARDRDP